MVVVMVWNSVLPEDSFKHGTFKKDFIYLFFRERVREGEKH